MPPGQNLIDRLGTGKHSLRMDALLSRFVLFAGGMIGHMILTLTKSDVQPDFIQARSATDEGACPRRAGFRLNKARLPFSGRPTPRFASSRRDPGPPPILFPQWHLRCWFQVRKG
jgi:hypothetical protein